MNNREKVIKGLEICYSLQSKCEDCPYHDLQIEQSCNDVLGLNALVLLKGQEPIKPTINEDGEAFCVCGENVGIIPSNKNLPSIRSKYCSECGRRMKWDD